MASQSLLGVCDAFSKVVKDSPCRRTYDNLHRQIVELVLQESRRVTAAEKDRQDAERKQEDDERKRRYAENRKKREALNVT